MKSRRETFNPFIALSDVTMATVVVLCCIFMAYMWLSNHVTAGNRSKIDKLVAENEELQKQLNALGDQLKKLEKENTTLVLLSDQQKTRVKQIQIIEEKMQAVTKLLNTRSKYNWPPSSAPPRLMIRMFDSNLFNDTKLSPVGRQQVNDFGYTLAETLSEQMQHRGRTSEGVLVEIQIQGHASENNDDQVAWERSIKRALDAQLVLSDIPDFPKELITVMGSGSRRTAYKASQQVINEYRKAQHLDTLSDLKPSVQLSETLASIGDQWEHLKSPQADRLDIVLIYAMDQNDDTYVPAHNDDGELLGPQTDLSHPGFPASSK